MDRSRIDLRADLASDKVELLPEQVKAVMPPTDQNAPDRSRSVIMRLFPSRFFATLRQSPAIVLMFGFWGWGATAQCEAQISESRIMSATEGRVATLEEQLINQLRATTDDRKAYVRLVVQLSNNGRLDPRLVLAIQRYAVRKNPQFPFPYFERAMRFEAEKRGIELPPVQLLAGSASTYLSR